MLVDGVPESARPWAFNPAESQFKLSILNGIIVVARDGIEPPTHGLAGLGELVGWVDRDGPEQVCCLPPMSSIGSDDWTEESDGGGVPGKFCTRRDEPHGQMKRQRKNRHKGQGAGIGVLLRILDVERKRWKSRKRIWFSSSLVLLLDSRRMICAPMGSRYCWPLMET